MLLSYALKKICCPPCGSFPVDEGGTVKSVVQYFQETYGFAI